MKQKYSKKHIAGLIVLIVLIILATVLVVVNPFKYMKSLQPVPTVAADEGPVAVSVRVMKLEPVDLQNTIVGNGNVVDPSSIDVYSEVAGTLTSLAVKLGQTVEKDQVIATIDPSRAGVTYKESVIKAPASGTVLMLPFVQGSVVSMQAPIARIGLLKDLEVVMDIAERHIGTVGVGTKAQMTFKAFPGEVFEAEVIRLSPVLNPATRTLEITLKVQDPDRKVKSGMFPSVVLNTERLEQVIAIPRSALLYSGSQAYVFTVGSDGLAKKKLVEVGLQVGDQVQITAGLTFGENLIVQGQSLMTEGTLVRILQ
ncbi:MAG: efflux RND transporter periplasmic adaptor subunit [Sphaerochaeta sp.]|jgi:multidrug efflux pump subunit AcrA (membrane-fusion protein)|uniref:efflux RND transporter periplasmic adaptor subunit n=1 Tax=Sphaerochaeta sp. TaxID=1972642 RepID=UPI002A3660A9|nr:efflux RND transporter periplasmic adaptor subunit [Sphaerochaeta sp.]MDX9825510.1 efflux RND transporter periplasmic adaptor subunit [Sphaerochaeta sp.]